MSDPMQQHLSRVEGDNSSKKSNVQIFWYGFGAVLIGLIIAVAGVGVYRAYAVAAQDWFTVGVARFLRLPIAKVNGSAVRYSDYADDLKAINVMVAHDQTIGGPAANLTPEQKSDQVLWRLINNTLVKQAAQKLGLAIAKKDIADVRSRILKNFPNERAADADIMSRYGWNLATYQTKVIEPYVLQAKLSDAIQLDDAGRAKLRSQAEEILQQIKGGASFEGLARKYGQDGTATKGGDLGWFAKGEMVYEFEAAAFKLNKGELSAEPVETEYGYHIIKVDDRRTTTALEGGKKVSKEEIKARHILLRFPAVDQYLDQLAKQSSIRLYAPIHNPFADVPLTNVSSTPLAPTQR